MRRLLGTVLAAAVGGGVAAAVLLTTGVAGRPGALTFVDPPLSVRAMPVLSSVGGHALSARELYRRAAPGVVFIHARTVRTRPSPYDGAPSSAGEATGAGIVLDADGLVLTVAHVVSAATEIRLSTGGRTVAATLVGLDARSDLALLRVDPSGLGLRALTLGDSGQVRVGDPVLAVGNPGGEERTLTTAVISATRGRVEGEDGMVADGVLRTDAPPGAGAAGGPLLDARGEIIGVSSQLMTRTGAVPFAVPVDVVRRMVPQLEAEGRAG